MKEYQSIKMGTPIRVSKVVKDSPSFTKSREEEQPPFDKFETYRSQCMYTPNSKNPTQSLQS